MRTAIRYALLFFVLFGLLYPLAITALGQLLFPRQANGSLIRSASGTIVGSALIGQNFTRPGYFHPRPSANNYDASNSGGSNYGPTSQKLMERIRKDATSYANAEHTSLIPVDAVTASASGLDPDISIANALLQAPRIAKVRGISESQVKTLIAGIQEKPGLGVQPGVNVLRLNLALDNLSKSP